MSSIHDLHLVDRIRYNLHYQRQFDSDFGTSITGSAKRYGMVVLSLLSLFLPKKMVSTLASCTRSVSCVGALNDSKDSSEKCFNLMKTAYAVAALAGTVYCSSLGMIMTTGYDSAASGIQLATHIAKEEYSSALKEGAQFFANSVYLALLFTGSVPLLLLSSSVNIIKGLYNAADEFKKGHDLEGVTNIIMTAARVDQFKTQCELLDPEYDDD